MKDKSKSNRWRRYYPRHAIRPTPDKLVHWTPVEEAYARKMMALSNEFFKTYGKGQKTYMVNPRHYHSNSIENIDSI